MEPLLVLNLLDMGSDTPTCPHQGTKGRGGIGGGSRCGERKAWPILSVLVEKLHTTEEVLAKPFIREIQGIFSTMAGIYDLLIAGSFLNSIRRTAPRLGTIGGHRQTLRRPPGKQAGAMVFRSPLNEEAVGPAVPWGTAGPTVITPARRNT